MKKALLLAIGMSMLAAHKALKDNGINPDDVEVINDINDIKPTFAQVNVPREPQIIQEFHKVAHYEPNLIVGHNKKNDYKPYHNLRYC